jgi:hypothetical protein
VVLIEPGPIATRFEARDRGVLPQCRYRSLTPPRDLPRRIARMRRPADLQARSRGRGRQARARAGQSATQISVTM